MTKTVPHVDRLVRIADLILGPINSMPGIKSLEEDGASISVLLDAYRRGEELRATYLVVGREHIGAVALLEDEVDLSHGDYTFDFALAGYCANLPEKVEVDENNVIVDIVWERHA